MSKEEILQAIFENTDIIFEALITGLNISDKKIEIIKKLWDILLCCTPPELLYHLNYHYYLLHPNDFLNLFLEFKEQIKEILK